MHLVLRSIFLAQLSKSIIHQTWGQQYARRARRRQTCLPHRPVLNQWLTWRCFLQSSWGCRDWSCTPLVCLLSHSYRSSKHTCQAWLSGLWLRSPRPSHPCRVPGSPSTSNTSCLDTAVAICLSYRPQMLWCGGVYEYLPGICSATQYL